jgi:hypothetical protein
MVLVHGREHDGRTNMKVIRLTQKQLRGIIREMLVKEATGGDGRLEAIDETNWQHLEVGNVYRCKVGRVRTKASFVGWVDKAGDPAAIEPEDPTEIELKFVDLETTGFSQEGEEWTAYFHGGHYCVGSSAEKLYVMELD